MKCLEITLIPPDISSGGGLGVYQSIKSLSASCSVDYIGPQYDEKIFENCVNNINKLKILSMNKCGIIKSIYRFMLRGVTTSFYDSWINTKDTINWSIYDFVHVESSRYKFIIDECHEHNKKCIVREHNIESDYAYTTYKLSHKVIDYIRYKAFAINEKAVLSSADLVIFITENDIKRSKLLFGIDINKSALNPVCIDSNQDNSLIKSSCEKIVLMTGSLEYEPNSKSIVWFVNNVWKEIEKLDELSHLKLIIAGRNPNIEIKKIVTYYHKISLIDTPTTMKPYFLNADIYVAAVNEGAGMKVKVAEALSYGLPVIGSQHAFIGYENIKYGKFLANKAEEFLNEIRVLCQYENLKGMRKDIQAEFENKLSMDSSIYRYKKFIERIISQ